MIPSEITNFISNIGFPITFCLLVYFDLRKKIDKLISSLETLIASS